jgi:hypothetical protein
MRTDNERMRLCLSDDNTLLSNVEVSTLAKGAKEG